MINPEEEAAARRQLLVLMEQLSEAHWFAGWLDGLEHHLWRMAHGGPPDPGFGVPTEEELSRLRELSQRAGGWWCWLDDETDVTFLPREEWERIYQVEPPFRIFEIGPGGAKTYNLGTGGG